jgi:hypothetical protein
LRQEVQGMSVFKDIKNKYNLHTNIAGIEYIEALEKEVVYQRELINKYESYLMENSVEEYEKNMQPYYEAMESYMISK